MDVTYRFSGFSVDPVRRLLFGPDGRPIALKPRVFDTLLYLVEHRGELLEKQALLDAIWPGVVVEDNNLNQAISTLRRVFGETRGENSFIVTEPGRGYRFVAHVETVADERPAVPAEPPAPAPRTDPRSVQPPLRKLAVAGAVAVLAAVTVFVALDAYRSPEPADANSPAVASEPAPNKSVAVLPFADLSADGNRAWLVDGVTEEILNSLAQLPELKVSGRTSSFQFRDAQTDIGEIAERLGVAHVLEGSVRLVGEDLRVTATLIRAQDGFQVWSNTYNGRSGELLDFQRDVAERVAGALDIVLDDGLRERMLAGGTRNVEAFEAYQEGRRATVDGLARGSEWEGVAHFERALTLDPGYALAALGKSAALTNPLLRGYPPSPYSQSNALEEIRESYAYVVANGATPTMRLVADINLESHSPTWYRMPGLLNRLRAEGDFDSVLLGGDGANWLPIVLVITNRLDIRGTLADRHVATDPLAVNSWLRKATNHRALGDYEAARAVLAEARQAVGRSPVYDLLEFTIAREEGKRDEVIAYLSTRSDPSSAMFLAAVRGEYETALRLADEGEKMIPVSVSLTHGSLMDTYYEAGATERLRTLVRRIDDAPHGTAILMQLITSFGGLSFDLADTPNFSAKLEQAGLNPTTYLKPLPRLSTLR